MVHESKTRADINEIETLFGSSFNKESEKHLTSQLLFVQTKLETFLWKSLALFQPSLHDKKHEFTLPYKNCHKRSQGRLFNLEISQNVHYSITLNI